LAGIIAFLDQNSVTGGKLVLFCFDDETCEEVEAELENSDKSNITDIYKRLRKESGHCIFAEITLDSIWNVAMKGKMRHEELKMAINESNLTEESKEMLKTILSDFAGETWRRRKRWNLLRPPSIC